MPRASVVRVNVGSANRGVNTILLRLPRERAVTSRDEKVENVAVEDGGLDDSSNMEL